MPASLYRLVGRQHHTEVTEQSNQILNQPEVGDSSPETVKVETPADVVTAESPTTVENIEVEPAVEAPVEKLDNTSAQISEELNVVKPAIPAWDPTWSKSQLLDVASKLGLNITALNTKAQIIDALTAASSR